jgi:HEPN domain-containing protein
MAFRVCRDGCGFHDVRAPIEGERFAVNVDTVVRYWLETAEDDWPVAEHLFASGDYRYALFFGHLYLEKLLKALVVQVTEEHAPRSHNLMLLAERAGLTVSEPRRDILVRVTGYNIEARYPEG